MVITGQATLFAIIKKDPGVHGRIFTAPERFVQHLGLSAATLLSQILYWTDRTKDVEGWFSKTQRQWAKELHLTDYEVKASLKKLRELGLVQMVTKTIKYGTTNMIRVAIQSLRKWWDKVSDPRRNSPTPPVEIQPTPPAKFDALTTKMINLDDGLDDSCSAKGEPQKLNEKNSEGDEMATGWKAKEGVKGKMPQSVTIIKKNYVDPLLAAPPSTVTKGAQANGQELAMFWKKAVPKYSEVSFVGALTQEHIGMLRHLMRKWEDAKVQHLVALEYVIKEWGSFCKTLQNSLGLKVFAQQPSIPFLVKYGNEAMNFYLTRQEVKTVQSGPSKGVTVMKNVPLPAAPEVGGVEGVGEGAVVEGAEPSSATNVTGVGKVVASSEETFSMDLLNELLAKSKAKKKAGPP